MADHTLKLTTVEDRLVYTGISVPANHNTTEKTSDIIVVPKGTPITLVVTMTTKTDVASQVYLEGSIDKVNFFKLKTIEADGNGSTSDMTTTNGLLTIAKTHVPATYGDFPYYRVATDAAASSGACVLTAALLIG